MEQLQEGRGVLFEKFLAELVIAGLEDFADVLGHVFADTGKLAEFLGVFADVLDAFVEAIEKLGDFFVAAIAADYGAIDFQQLRGLTEDSGDFFVFHFRSYWSVVTTLLACSMSFSTCSRKASGSENFRSSRRRLRNITSILPEVNCSAKSKRCDSIARLWPLNVGRTPMLVTDQ